MAEVIAIVTDVVATVADCTVVDVINCIMLADGIAKYMMADVVAKHVMVDVFCHLWQME